MPPSATPVTTWSPAQLDLSPMVQRIKDPSLQNRLVGLTGDDAQCIADFLSALLNEDNAFSSEDKKCLLTLLQKLAKSAQVFPQSYRLQGIRCDFTKAREGGAFADIFQGECQGRNVCVKAVRIFQKDDNARMLRAFAKEIVLWAHLSHENILPFYGIYQETSGRICIISPWMDAGDLSMYLQNSPDRTRMPMVLDVTAGLQYLHQSNIVHGDLKAKNILVSDYGRALIADFGISRTVVSTKLASTQLSYGTTRWMAPELFIGDGKNAPQVTLQSDVWSLSCVYYEILTRKYPYHDIDDRFLLFARYSTPKLTPSRPTNVNEMDDISEDMWNLMKKCWDLEPCSRPSCKDIYSLILNPARILEQRYSQDDVLWKATRGGSGVGTIYDRACHIISKLQEETLEQGKTIPRSDAGYELYAQMADLDEKREDVMHTLHQQMIKPGMDEEVVSLLDAQSEELERSGTKGGLSKWMVKQINPTKDVRTDDTIIAFMGPTGTGKSFFIDLLTGASDQDRRAGNTLKSVTSQIEATTVAHPFDENKRVVLVDTPPFDSTTCSEMQILQMISDWLQKIYKANVKLSGLIYLHRITDNMYTTYGNLRIFMELCGDIFMNQVFLVSTMWGKIKPEIGEGRETELKTKFWRPLIERGSSVERLSEATGDEAWRIVKKLIESHEKQPTNGVVLLQEEMVDLGMKLNETRVGKILYTPLQKQLAEQKDSLKLLLAQVERTSHPGLSKELKKEYDRIEAQFQKTFEEAKRLKVSPRTKIAGIFGGKKAQAKAVKIGEV